MSLVRKWFYFEMAKRNLKLLILLLACLAQPALSMGQDGAGPGSHAVIAVSRPAPDFNTDIYYRNNLELSLDMGAPPIHIPFVFAPFLVRHYSHYPPHH